jgi:serine/threonine protein kinase
MSMAASIICQVAEGLEYAHAQGIVHRDVKPGNVLVSPQGEAKLSDLGLAGPLGDQSETDPRYGKIVGTADYFSPDQIRDPVNPTPAWDIYSLGCTLYYTVTGKVPFPGGTTADKARAHCDLRPLDPRRLNRQLSPEFVEVMADMMAKDPALRLASAHEVIVRLSPFLSGQPGSASATFASAGSPPDDAVGRPVAVPPPVAPPIPRQRSTTMPVPRSPSMTPPPLTAESRPMASAALADTKTDFPGLPAGPIDEDSASSEVLETFEPTRGTDEDDSASVEILTAAPSDLLALLGPLTVFVLAPLALVGAVLVLWLLARSLM